MPKHLQASNDSDASRVVRVFISSTFRDMRLERECLVKRVFPELRRRFFDRGVEIVDVDLRWGITEDQAERGETLPVCLAEMERCRPWFIVMLGERYGWVPALSDDAADGLGWPADLRAASVTELEIVNGILRDPASAARALFYFRDPSYVATLPITDRPDHLPEDGIQAARLGALKERIRRSGVALHENYAGPDAFGDAVLEDVSRLIDQEWPGPVLGVGTETAKHNAFAAQHRRAFVGFERHLAALDGALTPGPARVIVTGPEGSGKSALLSAWSVAVSVRHPHILRIPVFISATRESAQADRMLEFLSCRLRDHTEVHAPEPNQSSARFAHALAAAAAAGPVLVLIDGLDQLTDRFAAASLNWLPRQLPENVSVVLSARADFPTEALEGRGFARLPLEPLSTAERAALVESYLRQFGKGLLAQQIEALASHPASGRPLFIRAALEALRLRADFQSLRDQLDDFLAARSLRELYERILGGLERDLEPTRPGLVSDAMTLLSVSVSGLSETELRTLLGENGEPLPRESWSRLHLALEGSLMDRGGLLMLAQDSLREAVHKRWVQSIKPMDAAAEAIAQFVRSTGSAAAPGMYRTEFLERERVMRRRIADALFPVDRLLDDREWDRAMDEGIEQLVEARAWAALYERLATRHTLRRAWRRHAALIIRAWRELERESPFRLCEAFRESLDAPGTHPASDGCLSGLLEAMGLTEAAATLVRSIAVRTTDDPFARAGACLTAAREAERAGSPERAAASQREALEEYRQALADFGPLGGKTVDAMAGCALWLAEFYHFKGEATEMRRFLDEAEHLCADGPHLPQLLLIKTRLGLAGGDLGRALALAEASAAASRDRRNFRALHDALSLLANIHNRRGHRAQAILALRERERIASLIGNV